MRLPVFAAILALLLQAAVVVAMPGPTGAAVGAERVVRGALATRALKARFDQALKRLRGKERADYVAALAARVSDDNPTLLDSRAAGLVGTWVVSAPISPSGQTFPALMADGLPGPGVKVTARPGSICARNCRTLGLEPHPLGTTSSDREAADALRLPAGSMAWLAYVDGRAEWLIVPTGTGPAIVTRGCTADTRTCGTVVLMPALGNTARILEFGRLQKQASGGC